MLATDSNVSPLQKWVAPMAPCSNFSNQWVSSNGEYIYMVQATFTQEQTNAYCSNRGGRSGQNKFTTKVESLAQCVAYVKSVPECGIWFDYGSTDGWCDCVKATDGDCTPADWNHYSTYKFDDASKDDCTIVATNPVERWSPHLGRISGRQLFMWDIIGTLSENGTAISWNDSVRTVWTVMEALPLQDGLNVARNMLQFAIETEQSVIQPYVSALYSIHPGTNANASSILHDLVVEEMLHMTTASNVLNAIGGHPSMNTSSFVPVYPMKLPFVNMTVSLKAFTKEQMDVFHQIEEATWGPDNAYRINTVGVYYFRIGMHLESLVKAYGEKAVYSGDPALQVNASSSRGIVKGCYGHDDAMKFLGGVYVQGEGNKGSLFETSPYTGQSELPHYYRFNEIKKNRCYKTADNRTHLENPTGDSLGIDWNSVHNFKPDPKSADLANHTDIHKQMLEFNSCYTNLLAGLHDVFNGSPQNFGKEVGNMMTIGQLAKKLMAIPHPEHPGMTVGPPWEWIGKCVGQCCATNGIKTNTVV